jgi:hypothetical protein
MQGSRFVRLGRGTEFAHGARRPQVEGIGVFAIIYAADDGGSSGWGIKRW